MTNEDFKGERRNEVFSDEETTTLACNEFEGLAHIRVIVDAGNTAPFEEVSHGAEPLATMSLI